MCVSTFGSWRLFRCGPCFSAAGFIRFRHTTVPAEDTPLVKDVASPPTVPRRLNVGSNSSYGCLDRRSSNATLHRTLTRVVRKKRCNKNRPDVQPPWAVSRAGASYTRGVSERDLEQSQRGVVAASVIEVVVRTYPPPFSFDWLLKSSFVCRRIFCSYIVYVSLLYIPMCAYK